MIPLNINAETNNSPFCAIIIIYYFQIQIMELAWLTWIKTINDSFLNIQCLFLWGEFYNDGGRLGISRELKLSLSTGCITNPNQ